MYFIHNSLGKWKTGIEEDNSLTKKGDRVLLKRQTELKRIEHIELRRHGWNHLFDFI